MMRGSEFAELRAFAEVARRGSFARAAEHLRIAPSTLSQSVRALEERLGATLLTRTTRRVAVTSVGARLLERFAPALGEMEAAVDEVREGGVRPRGVVRLRAPRPAYATHIEPRLGRLRAHLPDVTLDLSLDDAPLDAAPGDYELIVRRSEFIDDGMIARHLGGALKHTVVASPDHLRAFGKPTTPAHLVEHPCILWRPLGGEVQRWRFEAGGEVCVMAVGGPLIVSHCDAAVAAAVQNVGVAYVLQAYAEPFVARGELISLLGEHLPKFGGWRLCHDRRLRLTAAAQAVADLLTQDTEEMPASPRV